MNITKESIDTLHAKIKIELVIEDYRPQVDKILKEQRRKAAMPGFRPGKVPMGMINKMYGKSVMLDEVNKILYDSLYKYLDENKIETLGSPLLTTEHFPEFELENATPLEFSYEIGIAPDITIDYNNVGTMEYLSIETDDSTLEKHIKEIRRKFGKYISPEVSEDGDWLYGEFQELEDKEIKENGITHKSSVFTELIEDDNHKKKFIGLKNGDTLDFKPTDVYKNKSEVASLLGIKNEEVETLKSKFRFTVESVGRVELAELNENLFLKMYPDGAVKTEDDLKTKINSEYNVIYNQESDRKFLNDAATHIIEKTEIDLPETFLKKWLLRTSEKPLTEEQIEIEFPGFKRMIKWQIIENKIIKENNIMVQPEDVLNYAKTLVKKQLQQYGEFNSSDEELENITKHYLQNKEESKKIYENLFDVKITEVLKKAMKFDEKKISFTDFVKIVQDTNKKLEAEHGHVHDENCDHDHQ